MKILGLLVSADIYASARYVKAF